MNIKAWIIAVIGKSGNAYDLRVGKRITTKHGRGVITGGSIMVKLDKPIRNGKHNLPNTGFSFNLDKLYEKKK